MTDVERVTESYQKTVEIDGAYTQFKTVREATVGPDEDPDEISDELFDRCREVVNRRISEEKQRFNR